MKKAQLAKEAQLEEGEYEAAVRSEEITGDTTYKSLPALFSYVRFMSGGQTDAWKTSRCPACFERGLFCVAWRSTVANALSSMCEPSACVGCIKYGTGVKW